MNIALVTAEGAWETDDDSPLLIEALARLGISAGPARWDDATVDWADYDLLVIKSPWDYSDRPQQFLAWAEAASAATPMVNPLEILRWNSDKRYLGELTALGLPVVPTTYLSPDDSHTNIEAALVGQFDATRSASIVVKPTVSVGSKDTARYEFGELGAAAEHALSLLRVGREVMVQPYLGRVELAGETGLVFFGGEFSHAFRKGPLLSQGPSNVVGHYAVEEIEPRTPSEVELLLAREVVAIVAAKFPESELLYTRVDLVEDDEHRPVLLELEMIEPSYFLLTDPASPARAAAAYQAALYRTHGG